MSHHTTPRTLLPPTAANSASSSTARARGATRDLHATDRAIELACAGFRDAYHQAAAEIGDLGDRSPQQSFSARVSLGGAGNLGLDRLQASSL